MKETNTTHGWTRGWNGWKSVRWVARHLLSYRDHGSKPSNGPGVDVLRRQLLYAATRMARYEGIEDTVKELRTLGLSLTMPSSPIRLTVLDLQKEEV